MKRVLIVLALLAAVAVCGGYLALSLWGSSPPLGETIRLKATATILVDGVERTGSAVQEFQLQWVYEPQIGRTGAWRIASRGEAVRVDVPGEEPIYVLMSVSNDSGNYGFMIETQCTVRNEGPDAQRASFVNMKRCDFARFPKAIRFDDSGDYDTAIAVFTGGESRNGYQFVGMSFERTDEPVTEGTMPMHIWDNRKKSIRVPFDGFTEVAGSLEFKTEKFW